MVDTSEYNGLELILTVVIVLTLAYASVLLRCYVRLRITNAFQLDDWLMLISLVIFTSSCSFILAGVHYGIGRHNIALTIDNQIQGLKYQALATLFYVANMMFIKLSIAIFLLRIAVKKLYIWILRISMGVVLIWSTAIFIFDLFQCNPVQAQWDFTIEGYTCVPGSSFAAAAYSISVMTILTDWMYALLPIPMIWSVQMSVQAKATVAFILSLGIFASIATIIRLKYIVELTDISDVLYTGTAAMVWTLVEPGVAIIAASLVTIRPLLRTLKLHGFSSDPSSRAYHFSSSRHQQLSLRNDIPDGNWGESSISAGGGTELKSTSSRRAWKGRGSVHINDKLSESSRMGTDAESEEYILERGEGGITRTVDVRVHHHRLSSVEIPKG